jgi:hypothetical protein
MASQQTAPSLPGDQATLRFYLEGIHHFLQWCEREIGMSLNALPLVCSPGRLYLVFQQILKPYLGMGNDTQGGTTYLATTYPSAESTGNPFEVTPAFLAVQPFLDHKEIVARLARCRSAVEDVEPIPASLELFSPPSRGRVHQKITREKKRSELTAEEAQEAALRQKALDQRRSREREKLLTALAAIGGLLDPFRNLAQRIRLEMAGTEQPAPGGQDESGFVLASVLKHVDKHVNTDKKLQRFLKQNPQIRRRRPLSKKGKPHPQRLEIHAADLLKVLYGKDSATFDEADEDDGADEDDEVPPLDEAREGVLPKADSDAGTTVLPPEADQRRLEILKEHSLSERPYNSRPDLDDSD